MFSSQTHAHGDHRPGFGRPREQGRKCTGRDNSTGQKFPLHRQIAIDPQANILQYRALGDRHTACLRYRATLYRRRTKHPMTISSVTAFGPITSAMFPQTAGSSAGSAAGVSASGTTSQDNSVVQDFLNYAKMSPAERMREEILKSLGMTEQQFEKLSPTQQQAVNQKIQQIMLQQLQQNAGKTGQLVNVSA
jgi:hypothetical protein